MSAMTVSSLEESTTPHVGWAPAVVGPDERPAAIPCAARPSTGFVHRDGRCLCFAGGPAPEFAAPPRLGPARPHLTLAP